MDLAQKVCGFEMARVKTPIRQYRHLYVCALVRTRAYLCVSICVSVRTMCVFVRILRICAYCAYCAYLCVFVRTREYLRVSICVFVRILCVSVMYSRIVVFTHVLSIVMGNSLIQRGERFRSHSAGQETASMREAVTC